MAPNEPKPSINVIKKTKIETHIKLNEAKN